MPKRLKERGAEHGFHVGWEQPNWFALPGDDVGYKPSFRRTNWFEPVGRECDMVLNRVGIIDLTPFGKIEVSGKDAAKFLDVMVANKLPKVRIFTSVQYLDRKQLTLSTQCTAKSNEFPRQD